MEMTFSHKQPQVGIDPLDPLKRVGTSSNYFRQPKTHTTPEEYQNAPFYLFIYTNIRTVYRAVS